jgi:hypothetical protein
MQEMQKEEEELRTLAAVIRASERDRTRARLTAEYGEPEAFDAMSARLIKDFDFVNKFCERSRPDANCAVLAADLLTGCRSEDGGETRETRAACLRVTTRMIRARVYDVAS